MGDVVLSVLATNRLEDIDEAVLSRMDYKLHIAAPKNLYKSNQKEFVKVR